MSIDQIMDKWNTFRDKQISGKMDDMIRRTRAYYIVCKKYGLSSLSTQLKSVSNLA